ncbi:MAG: PLDc N-terminal domain-containing protein [Pedococcus sp.]
MRGLFEGWHVIVLVGFVLWLWALVDALRNPDQRWKAAGHNKVLYVVLIVILGWVGALLYALIPRPALRRVAPSAKSLVHAA